MRTMCDSLIVLLAALCLSGCQTVYTTDRAPSDKLAQEGTTVFVRPDHYTILGTRSMRDYLEITYERAAPNEAGLLKVELGLRNRGAQHWFNRQGPAIQISVKTAFYIDPVTGRGPTGAPVYLTNWRLLTLNRGETEHFDVICPDPRGKSYQITVSEELGR